MEFFLKSREGANLCRCQDNIGVSPLHLAILKRHNELVEAILKKASTSVGVPWLHKVIYVCIREYASISYMV